MYGFMFTAHTPLFSVYLAQPNILTYHRFDSKDLYIFVIAISQLSTNSMQPSMQGLWISSKTNTDNQSVKIKRFVPVSNSISFLYAVFYGGVQQNYKDTLPIVTDKKCVNTQKLYLYKIRKRTLHKNTDKQQTQSFDK